MTTDLYSTELWLDGQEVETDKLNNGQRFLRAQLTDQVLQQMIGAVSNTATRPDFGGDDGANVSTLWAYCLSPGRAFLRQGSANNKIQIAPGTLLQKIANAAGADSTLVPFTFAGTEEWTIASGDATNPRVDLLQMALSYTTDTPANVDFQDAATRANTTVVGTATKRRLLCTLSVKQGTPGASPVIPDPDAGAVPVGTAVVGHGWTSAGAAPIFGVDTAEINNVVIHDQRMPIGIRTLVTDPALYKPETGWALSADKTVAGTNNATNLLFARCQTNVGRVVAVDLHTGGATVPLSTVTLGCDPLGNSGSYIVENDFGTNIFSTLIARSRRIDFETKHHPLFGPTIQASTVNKIGVPLWASGWRTPQIGTSSGIPSFAHLRIQNANNPVNVGPTIFFVAG